MEEVQVHKKKPDNSFCFITVCEALLLWRAVIGGLGWGLGNAHISVVIKHSLRLSTKSLFSLKVKGKFLFRLTEPQGT